MEMGVTGPWVSMSGLGSVTNVLLSLFVSIITQRNLFSLSCLWAPTDGSEVVSVSPQLSLLGLYNVRPLSVALPHHCSTFSPSPLIVQLY